MVAFLVAIVTNYVTAQPPKWAENTLLAWSVFGALAMVSLGLFFWERRLAAQAPENGVRPVPLGRIAVGGHSMNPPTASARVRGREAELERIGARVRASGGGMVVVCGAGGLGKTTLAAESAAQARAQGQAVVWIRWRGDPAQLGQDLAQAAHILGLPDSRLEEARMGRVSLVDAVWEHLADVTGWLIVVDNVDTPARAGPGSGPPAAYRGWLRPYGGGVLLVTSRDTTRQTWGPDADVLHLQPLADDAGGAVLLDAAPHAGTENEAEALAARLGGLPLGLNAAATYLSVPTSRHRTFTAYQHAMETEFADLLGAEHPTAATDPDTARLVVRHTWDLSLDQLHRNSYTLARPVLQLLALLEPAPVPRNLITPKLVTDATGLPATVATVDAALAGLHQYGLLHTHGAVDGSEPGSPAMGRLQLHPLVREVTAHTLTRPEPTSTWLTAIDTHLAEAVDAVAGMPGRTGWPTARLLAPHLPAHLDRNTPHNSATARSGLDELVRQTPFQVVFRQILDDELGFGAFGVQPPVGVGHRLRLGVVAPLADEGGDRHVRGVDAGAGERRVKVEDPVAHPAGGDLDVRHVRGDHRPRPRPAADQDRPGAALQHAGQDVLHRRDTAEQVEIQLGQNRVDGDLRGLDQRRPAQVGQGRRGRVLEYVDRSQPLLGGGERRVQCGAVGHVGGERLGPYARVGQVVGNRLQRRTAAGDQRHVEPLGGEPPADRVPQLRACAHDRECAQFATPLPLYRHSGLRMSDLRCMPEQPYEACGLGASDRCVSPNRRFATTMSGTFSADVSGANAFSDFAHEWRSRMGETFALAPFRRTTVSGFSARSRGFRVRDMMFNRFETAAALRTVGRRVGADDHVRLWIVHRGTWRFEETGGAEHTAPAGRLLVQTGRLSHFSAAPHTLVQVLVLPAAEVRPGRGGPASGPADTAEVRLLTAHAAMVGRMLDRLRPAGIDAARGTLAELARAAAGGGLDDVEPLLSPALAQAARDLAGRRLTDSDLSPSALARELNVSPRTLQRAFAREGRPLSTYIRRRRLEEARRELVAPHRRMTITEIAARWQFADSGHFARAFRKYYGRTPTDYAATAARETDAT